MRAVFGEQDEQLATLMPRAVAAGLPDIAVSADVGRFLKMLTGLAAPGGARLAVEVGTLGGYSGIWIARGLAPGGRLITVESDPKHAEFARRELEDAGVADRVEIRVGTGLVELANLARQLGPGSIDLVFLDAIKSEYPGYFEAIRAAIRPGGLLVADNALGSGSWWIDESPGSSPDRDGADRLNRILANDPGFESVAVPMREGILIARKS